MRIATSLLSIILGVIFVPYTTPALADSSTVSVTDRVFSAAERTIIERYYGVEPGSPDEDAGTDKKSDKSKDKKKSGKSGELPPGLAKRDTLPPGLARRETLPPGLAKRDLPDNLQRDLPPSAPGTERAIVDGVVVLVEIATGKVLDIIEEVIARD